MRSNTVMTITLICTAVIVAALILIRASTLVDNAAHAEMAVSQNGFTMITTRYLGDSEILYVLDSRSGRLYAYLHNPNQQTIDLLDGMDLARAFLSGSESDQDRDAPKRKAR